MKRKHTIVIATAVVLLMPVIAVPQAKKLPKKEKGMGLVLSNMGFGIGGAFNPRPGASYILTSDVEMMSIRGEDEYEICGYQYGQYVCLKIGDRNLLLLPLMIGVKKFLWKDKIAENFQPYLQLVTGPVIALDLVENVGFLEQFKRSKTHATVGARVTMGANIQNDKRAFINLSVGYGYMKFSEVLDGRESFSGVAFRAGIGRWF